MRQSSGTPGPAEHGNRYRALAAQTLAARDRLAEACLADGQARKAISHYKKVLGRDRVLGRGHPETITSRAGLAAACFAAGRMPSATQIFEQCCTDSGKPSASASPTPGSVGAPAIGPTSTGTYQALRLEMMALFADIGIACG